MRCFAAFVVLSACASDPGVAEAAPCIPPADGTAPTYTELFTQYFAPTTPGHCATAGCHADPDHDEWLCGDWPATCYRGMVQIRLIDPADPTASMIGDPSRSPLSWVNPTGDMPFDGTGPFAAGRDAIVAWVAACAQDN